MGGKLLKARLCNFQLVSTQWLVTTIYSIFWHSDLHKSIFKETFSTFFKVPFNFFFSMSSTCMQSIFPFWRDIFLHSRWASYIIKLTPSSSKIENGCSCIRIQCFARSLILAISNLLSCKGEINWPPIASDSSTSTKLILLWFFKFFLCMHLSSNELWFLLWNM